MLRGLMEFSYLLGVDSFWVFLILGLLLLLGIVKAMYPWQPKWKSKITKDKDGNEITTYYQIKE